MALNHRWDNKWGPYGVPIEKRNRFFGFCPATCARCGLRRRYFNNMQIPYYFVEITAGVWTWAQVRMPKCFFREDEQ